MTTRRLLAVSSALALAAALAFLAIPAAFGQSPKDPVELLEKRFALADKLLGEGEKEQAFAHYLWCVDRAQALGLPDRHLDAIHAIQKLAGDYPDAGDALRERRDFAEEKILSGRGDGDVAWTYAILNREFAEEERTLATLDQLPSGDRSNRVARRTLASFIYPTLVERRRYEPAADTLDAERLASLTETGALLDAFEVLVGAGEPGAANALAERLLARDESIARRADLIARAIRADHPEVARELAETAWKAAASSGERQRVMAAASSIPGGFTPPADPTPRPTPPPRATPRMTPEPVESRTMIASAAGLGGMSEDGGDGSDGGGLSAPAMGSVASMGATNSGASDSEEARSWPVESEEVAMGNPASGMAATGAASTGSETMDGAAVPVRENPIHGIDALAWMGGEWTASVNGSPYTEYWLPPASKTMGGVARLVTPRGYSMEFMQLEERADGTIWFLVNLNRRTGFEQFRAVEATAERLALENAQNDFPKRIVYEKTATGMQALLFDSVGDHAGKRPGMAYVFSPSR